MNLLGSRGFAAAHAPNWVSPRSAAPSRHHESCCISFRVTMLEGSGSVISCSRMEACHDAGESRMRIISDIYRGSLITHAQAWSS